MGWVGLGWGNANISRTSLFVRWKFARTNTLVRANTFHAVTRRSPLDLDFFLRGLEIGPLVELPPPLSFALGDDPKPCRYERGRVSLGLRVEA